MVAKKQFDCTRDAKNEASDDLSEGDEAASVCWGADDFNFYYGYEDLSLFLLVRAVRSLDGLGKGEQINPDLNQNDAIVTLPLCEFK